MKVKSFRRFCLVVAGCHFGASMLIVPLTLRVGDILMAGNGESLLLGGLHVLTRVLYFPILGLALYPRHWFPGPWISIPILINSLLWGIVLAGIFRLATSLGTKR